MSCCVPSSHSIFKNDAGRMPSDAELEAIIDRSALQAEFDAQMNGTTVEGVWHARLSTCWINHVKITVNGT